MCLCVCDTEAGKLALNFVRRHLPKAASASSMEATRTVELKTMAQEHVGNVLFKILGRHIGKNESFLS